MPVTCPNCQSTIPAADVELRTQLAKCRQCDEVFALDVPGASPRPRPAVMQAMPPVPAGVRVSDDGLRRTLVFGWFTPVALFLLFFCIAWDSFLVFWYSIAVAGGDKTPWLMVVFPIAHVAVGVGLTYFTLCLFVNRTTVTVDDTLRVQHGPLFWPGGVTVPAEAISAVYCEEVASSSKRGVRYTYAVKAMTTDARSVPLLTGVDTLPRAKFFELKLEEWLGLPPTAVPGEVV